MKFNSKLIQYMYKPSRSFEQVSLERGVLNKNQIPTMYIELHTTEQKAII